MRATDEGLQPAVAGRMGHLIGRDQLVRRAVAALAGDPPRAVALVGDGGSGTTALGRAIVGALADRLHVVVLDSWPGAANTAHAALSNLFVEMPAVERGDALAVTRAVADHLDARRGSLPCLLWLDDAHDVDDASAAVLSRLLIAGKVRLLVSCPRLADLPRQLGAVLRDRVERVEVPPLSLDQVAAVLTTALGGTPTLGATRQIWRASGGTPSFVHALVPDARRAGNLIEHEGMWAWNGPDAEAGDHVRELVAAQLAARDAGQREALELVALAEPLALPVLLSVVTTADLDALERDRLLTIDGDSPPTVRLALPVYAAAVRSLVPAGRRTELRRRMIGALDDIADGSLPALMRSVGWALDCGADVTPSRLVRTAELANQAHDHVFAARAARAALTTGVDHHARLELAIAYRCMGRVDDALAVLEAGRAVSVDQRVELLLARATVLQYSLDRVDDALEVLDEALAIAPSATLRQAICARRFVHTVYGGRIAPHPDEGEGLLADPTTPAQLRSEVVPAVALLRTCTGRSDSALTLLRETRSLLGPDPARHPWMAEELVYMDAAVSLLRGSEVITSSAAELELASFRPAVRFDAGMEELGAGWAVLNEGRAADAGALLHAALASFAARDTSGFRALAAALAAEAAALSGAHERSLALAAECRSTPRRTSHMLAAQLDRALLWPTALAAGSARAIAEGRELGERLAAEGSIALAAHVMHDVLRLGDGSVAGEVARLAADCDLPRVQACGRHAAGLAAADGHQIAEGAAAFASIGFRLHAAEAWSDAAAAFTMSGLRDSARRATAAVAAARAGLGTVGTPRLLRTVGAEPLTRREVEIVSLASTNLTNGEIAERLGIGRRTVEGHLHRAYAKLGVSNREQLASVLP